MTDQGRDLSLELFGGLRTRQRGGTRELILLMQTLIKWIAVRAAVILTIAVVAGLAYQFIATLRDDARYREPGVMVDASGQRLHLYCTGAGERTVILEAGLGGGVLDWQVVQPEISSFARVCSYDRAGAGWSEPGEGPRSGAEVADELHDLLARAGLRPPFVMVGHSIGGVLVQFYASRYPQEVAAVVLVDASHAEQDLRPELAKPPRFTSLLVKALAPVGVGRIVFTFMPQENVPSELAAARAAIYSHTTHLYATADELASLPAMLAELREARVSLGSTPLFVISRAAPPNDAGESAWRELQIDLTNLSTRSAHIVAESSGHYVQFDEPQTVVDAVRRAVESLR